MLILLCLKVLKDGYKVDYRFIIRLDGCFLKGLIWGELLIGIGRNVNGMYPIIWVMIKFEILIYENGLLWYLMIIWNLEMVMM